MNMVSYYNPLAMYRQHQQASTPGGVPSQFHHHQPSPPVWYGPPGGYQPHQGQQYLPEGMEHQQPPWHHHPMFPEWSSQSAEFPSHPTVEDPQLPSPPITVSSSELSSPGAAGGTHTPPQHSRPLAVRSPYEWMKKPSYQSQPNPGKTRTKDKYRVVYSDHQRLELEKEFHYSRYITIRRKAELASNLGLSERQVKIWFQNRRAKERKQVKKREELIHKEKMDAVQHFQHLHAGAAASAPLPPAGL